MREQTVGDLELLRVMNRIRMFRHTGWGLGGRGCMPTCIVTNNLAGMIRAKSPMTLKQIALIVNWVQSYMPSETATISGCIAYSGIWEANIIYRDRNGVERST